MAPSAQTRPWENVEQGSRPVGPITRRLIYALVLIPIVPSVSVVGATFCAIHVDTGYLDDLRWFHLFFSILWVTATIIIWRSVIVWTLGRRWLSALVGLIPFVQVVYGQPLWHVGGCLAFEDDFLRLGQHDIGIGLWVWLAIWVWWGWEKRQMSEAESDTIRTVRMTSTAKRIVASIGSIPVVFGLFWIIAVFLDDVGGLGSDCWSEAFALTAVIAVVVWVLIWRRSVVWSATVIRHTAISVAGLLAVPIAAQWAYVESVDDVWEVTLFVLPVIGWGVWMAGTVRLWPMQATESPGGDLTPHCLKCGYLLKGLRATRCPECGDEPTLDELWEATVGAV